MEPAKQPKRFHYAWVIFAVSCLSVFTSLGFCSSPKSLFLSAITEDLNIPRSLFSIGNSCRFITTAIITLFFGKLVIKLGPRKIIAAGFACLTLSNLIGAASNGVLGFYISNVFLGLGLAWTTTSLVGVVVEKWFVGNKGTIMGFILASNGLGGAVSSQILSRIIYAKADGWRMAYMVAAAIMVVVGIIIVLLMRNNPEDVNTHALGNGTVSQKKQRGREWVGIDARDAFHKPYFYACLVCVFFTGMILQSVAGISSAHMRDQGISVEVIANVLSIGSLALMISKMSIGACFDRFGLRIAMIFCDVCAVTAIGMLAYVDNGVNATVFKIIDAFGLPLETIMLPLITKECFGQKSFAFLMGVMVSVNTLGYSVGSPLMNLVYDITGTYSNALIFMAYFMVAVAVVMQLVITAAHKERAKVEAVVKN